MTTSGNRDNRRLETLRDLVEDWIALDVEHRDLLLSLLASDPDQVARLFGGRLSFGTAGLRAKMGPGPMRMNRLVVRQTTAGLVSWLSSARGLPSPSIVVGFDARHNSEVFASDVAAVVTAFGARVDLIDRPTPTPVLARAVLDQRADAGIMITASHNPPEDNGYKLYLGDGLQIVSPVDNEIATAIEGFSKVDPLDVSRSQELGPIRIITEAAAAAHRNAACGVVGSDRQAIEARRGLRVVYTPIHGVGGDHFVACMQRAGFAAPVLVAEEFMPDPAFPGTPFPNPEEPGTLDRAFKLAAQQGADVVLANDPDADRLAVGLPDSTGDWKRLTGDEVGVLLADQAISKARSDPRVDLARCLVSSSIVSSRMIERLAQAAGVQSVRTLTGFKWIARPMVEQGDLRFLFGYEEALGYCIGDRVRDKDGVSAALAVADLVAELKGRDMTIRDRLDQLSFEHGMHTTMQVTVRFDHVEDGQRAQVMADASSVAPVRLAGIPVIERIDLTRGESLPPSPGVVLGLADGSRVLVRPSGTEPKVKVYIEVRSEVSSIEEIERVRGATSRRVQQLAAACEEMLTG